MAQGQKFPTFDDVKVKLHIPRSPRARKVSYVMWMVEDTESADFNVEKIVPFGSFDLIFHLGDSFVQSFDQQQWTKQPSVLMTGHFEKSIMIKALGKYKTLGISFYPWCGDLFCKFPLTELTSGFASGEVISRDFLLGYWHEFLTKENDEDIFILAEEMVESQVKGYEENRVTKVLTQSILSDPNIELHRLYDQVAYSHRRIEQIFLERTGISAKFFKKKSRFQYALNFSRNNPSLSLTEVAHHTGYYDQANFIKVFKQFTGVTPTAFFRSTDNIGGKLECYIFNRQCDAA